MEKCELLEVYANNMVNTKNPKFLSLLLQKVTFIKMDSAL